MTAIDLTARVDWLLQFEPEMFVDGLLGVGAAGGTSVKNEGAMLAARLGELRKERAARAEQKKVAPRVVEPMSTPQMAQVGSANSGGKPSLRKNKKKRKKKSRK